MGPGQLIGDAGMSITERGWLPDATMRWGIRWLCAQRLRAEHCSSASPHGYDRTVGSSFTCSATANWLTPSKKKGQATGWGAISSLAD